MPCPSSAVIHYHPLTSVTKKTNIIPTSTLPIAGFIADEPTVGQIRISRSLSDHPTGQVTLFLTPSDTETLDEVIEAKEDQYCSGTEVEIFGIKFVVDRTNTVKKSIRANLTRTAELRIDLTGKWSPYANTRRQPLDEPYKIENKNNLLLSDAIALSNTQYFGEDIRIYLEGNSRTNIITPRELLENNAKALKGFVFYSNPEGVEIKSWGNTTRRQLPLSIIKTQDISMPKIGYGAKLTGVKLAEEFRNTQFTPKQFIGNTGIEILVEYENATNEIEFNSPLYENASWAVFGPAVLEPFRNGNNTFDNSSQVRKKRILEVKNGETIRQSETIKGWEYLTISFYSIDANSITWSPPSVLVVNGFWKTIETSYTEKYYNPDGYWLGDSFNGQRRARYKQETGFESSEAQKEVEAGDTSYEAIRDSYNFFNLPTNGTTLVTLEEKGNYYADASPGDDGVAPLFMRRTQKTELNIVSAPDPASTADNPLPDMVTGRDFFEEKIINITSPKDSTSPQNPERFREVNYTRNAQGEALSRYAKQGNSREFSGRPGNAPRLIDLTGDYQNPTGDLVAGSSYLLVSEGAEVSDDIPRGSATFDSVYTQSELLEVAQVELSKKNIKAMTTQLDINQWLDWNEGDIVNFDNRDWVLNSIDFTIEPDRTTGSTRLLNKGFNIELGSYLLPGISLYLVTEDDRLVLVGSI